MSETKEIRGLLDRLGRDISGHSQLAVPVTVKQSQVLQPYKAQNSWPGADYRLIGNSYNTDYKIVDTKLEASRCGCITLMFESYSHSNYCLPVKDALLHEGFLEVLSRFERDWLSRVSADTLIGPAYDQLGNRIRTSFAVWAVACTRAESTPRLVSHY